jgi:hypothetical protein
VDVRDETVRNMKSLLHRTTSDFSMDATKAIDIPGRYIEFMTCINVLVCKYRHEYTSKAHHSKICLSLN